MARTPNTPNAARPEWYAPLQQRVPACFSAAAWQTYLDGVAREAAISPTLRKHLERGGAPNHCIGCSSAGRIEMHAAGKCLPVTGAK